MTARDWVVVVAVWFVAFVLTCALVATLHAYVVGRWFAWLDTPTTRGSSVAVGVLCATFAGLPAMGVGMTLDARRRRTP